MDSEQEGTDEAEGRLRGYEKKGHLIRVERASDTKGRYDTRKDQLPSNGSNDSSTIDACRL